jgi:HAD superfamily hydrolase (TIGR01509 family)
MPLRNYQYWIFDMDGTLTLPIHDFEWIRSQIGIDSGTPILEAIEQMSREDSVRARRRLHDLELELAYRAEPQPGVTDMLDMLVDKKRKLAILTRNDEDIGYATLKAAGLERYFDTNLVIGRETCAPKPQPDGVHYLLDLWQAPKNSTVIVGDYLYDIQAGFEAGISTVHFDRSGEFPWPRFTHFRITRIDDLLSMI